MIYRELRPEEFDRVPPEALAGWALSPNQRVSAAFNGDEIVGIWATTYALHAEPIWIRADYRKHPVILKRLWDGVKGIVRDMGLGGVVGIIPDSVPEDKRIAEWLGAEQLPGSIYLWLDREN